MAEYGAAKARLFSWPGPRLLGDQRRRSLRPAADRRGARPRRPRALLRTRERRRRRDRRRDGARAATRSACRRRGARGAVETGVVGAFNVSNLLATLGALLASDVELDAALDALARLAPPPGRMERHGGDGKPLVVIDYAHTPDALEKVLAALRPVVDARGASSSACSAAAAIAIPASGRVMGRIAGALADRVIVTNDNPRFEDPAAIASAVSRASSSRASGAGWSSSTAPPRSKLPCTRRKPGDVVLVAGKGHEAYQEFAGERHAVRRRARRRGRARRLERCMMDLATAAHAVRGRVDGANVRFARVTTDSRAVERGDLFVALAGRALRRPRLRRERVRPRRRGGAGRRRTAARSPARSSRCPTRSPRSGAWPRDWRARFALPLARGRRLQRQDDGQGDGRLDPARARSASRRRSRRAGNLNNAIGLPLTLLRLHAGHRVAVVEVGMNHRGETRELCADRAADDRRRQQRAARAPGVHGERRRSRRRARRRDRRAPARAASRCSTPTTRRCGLWREAARAPERTSARSRCDAPRRRHRAATRRRSRQRARAARRRQGDATSRLARSGRADGAQRARRGRDGARGRRPARRGRARARGVPPGGGPARDDARAVGGDRHRRHATTRIPIRCARRSTCWRAQAASAGSCWATWAKSAREGPAVPSRDRRLRARARRRAPRRDRRARARSGRRVRRRRALASRRRRAGGGRRAGRDAGARRSWSRARASCAWSAWSPRSRRAPAGGH